MVIYIDPERTQFVFAKLEIREKNLFLLSLM